MRSTRIFILAAVAATLVVAPGCGGGDGDSDPAVGSAADPAGADVANADAGTKAGFIKTAEAICRRVDERMQKELETHLAESGSGSSVRETNEEVVTDVLIPGIKEQIDEVGALEPPDGDSRRVGAILARLERAVDQAQADPWGYSQRRAPFAKSEALARKYGFSACGGP